MEQLRQQCKKQCIQIGVKRIAGKNIKLFLRTNSSIESVKESLMNYEGVLPEHQRLFFKGQELEDSNKMKL